MSKENGNNNDELVFNPGEVIAGCKLIRKIDEGGFGQVFHVQDVKSNKQYAMKIESNSQEGGSAIKLEMNVLKQLRGEIVFPGYFRGGRKVRFHYLVLELLGDNLKMLKARSTNPEVWSDGTWSRVGIQCLYALKVLHNRGFVHRDVKPSNFAIGLNSTDVMRCRTILLFDFGLARKFIKSEKKTLTAKSKKVAPSKSKTQATKKPTTEAQTMTNKGKQRSRKKQHVAVQAQVTIGFAKRIKAPPVPKNDLKDMTVDEEGLREEYAFRIARPHTDFRGTHQYASPNAHRQIELGRHDDIWSLMYMIAEMFLELPWTNNEEIPVEDLKAQASLLRLFSDPKTPSRLTSEMRGKLERIQEMLQDCDYYKHPKYDLVHKFLESVMIKSGVKWETPYDWETKNHDFSMGAKKGAKEKPKWENPKDFFEEDKWANLRAPTMSPSPSAKHETPPAPMNKINNKGNDRQKDGQKCSKEDSQAGGDDDPLDPDAKSGKDGPAHAAPAAQSGKSLEPGKR